jgi:hypothetical protein
MKTLNKTIALTLSITVISYLLLSSIVSDEKNENKIKLRSTSSPKASFESKKARSDYFHKMLRDPETKEIPKGIRQKELAFAKQLQEKNKSLNKSSLINDLGWQEAGPSNVGGRTRALAVDIADPNTIIAGGVSGGIWKSTDNGNSWEMKSTTSQILSVTALAQDPRPGQTNTWYYGAGEYTANSAAALFELFTGDGIYKSTDNGETWNILPSTLGPDITNIDSPFDHVTKIEINPVTGSVFVAANGVGILRSTDGGNSFSIAIGGPGNHLFSDISIASNGAMVVVLSPLGNASSQNAPGIYKSNDDGTTWENITPASFPQKHERSQIEIAPSNPNVAYLLTFVGPLQNTQYEDTKFYKINILNGSSEDRSNNLPVFTSPFGGDERFNSQQSYNITLAIKPDDENYVIIGGTSLFRSKDGFSTQPNDSKLDWIGGYHPQYVSYPNFHPDVHSYSFDPNDPNAVWWGHDGGLSYTSDITNQNYQELFPWENKNNGYNVTQFYHISLPDIAGDNRIMGGTQDNGTPFIIFDGDIGERLVDASSGDGGYSYFGDDFAFTSNQNGVLLRYRYDNNNYPNFQAGFTRYTPENATGQLFINPFAIDPNDENIIYYPAGNSLWRNNQLSSIPDYQFGTTSLGWTKLDNVSMPTGYVISSMAASKINPAHRIYYGGIEFGQQPTGIHKIFKLDNANTSTTGAVEITVPGIKKWSFPNFIAINPDNADEIIVVFSNYNIVGVYHSIDGGQSYTAIEGNLEGDGSLPGPSVRSAAILPTSNGTQYFLATSTGVYSTTSLNGSNTMWNPEGANTMGNVVVNSLAARPSDGRIVAGTHGRGAFVANAGSGVGGAIANVNINSLTLQTKPGQSSSTSFILSNNGDASLNYNVTVSGNFGENLNKISNPKFELSPPDVNSEEYKEFISKSKIMLAKEQLRKSQNNFVAPSESKSINGNDYLILDDGDLNADTFAGLGGGLDFDCYNEFSVSGAGFEVEKIEFFIKTEQAFSNFINAAIYDNNDSLLQFGVFSFDLSSNGKWFDATLNPKIKFNNGESFKVEIYSYSLINQPMGTDTDAQIPNNSYFFNPLTVKWENLNTQPGFENGAFLIRAKGTRTGGGGNNQNPVAVATASKSQASVNESITFDGSQSYDNDGQISQYLWEFGDGNSSTQAMVTHSYSNSGTFNIKLTVTDNLGATGTATGQIIIGGSNQNLVTANPSSGIIAPGGSQTITLTLDAQNLVVGSYTGQVSISTNGGNITIPIDYLVNVEKISSTPDNYRLTQNYPNPFNPTTTIEFSLPQNSKVLLKVYDVLGKEVISLVNEEKSAGSYKVNFDAGNLSSGLYFYKLETENFNEVKKMLLVK